MKKGLARIWQGIQAGIPFCNHKWEVFTRESFLTLCVGEGEKVTFQCELCATRRKVHIMGLNHNETREEIAKHLALRS